jgi:hypothetical protein
MTARQRKISHALREGSLQLPIRIVVRRESIHALAEEPSSTHRHQGFGECRSHGNALSAGLSLQGRIQSSSDRSQFKSPMNPRCWPS